MRVSQVVIFIDGREHVRMPVDLIGHTGIDAIVACIRETWDIGAEESALNSLGLCIYLFTNQPAFQIGA